MIDAEKAQVSRDDWICKRTEEIHNTLNDEAIAAMLYFSQPIRPNHRHHEEAFGSVKEALSEVLWDYCAIVAKQEWEADYD